MNKLDLLIVGVGGQGIVMASDILGEVALTLGYDVKKTDTLGMAQRGGSVVSHVRIAERVWSPLIKEGEADVLLALEKLEAVRWSHYLQPEGIAIVNDYALPPLSVSLGIHRYPSNDEIKRILEERAMHVYFVDGIDKAKRLGDVRVLNMFMLGYVSHLLPGEIQTWEKCIAQRVPTKALRINLIAFNEGVKEARNVNLK